MAANLQKQIFLSYNHGVKPIVQQIDKRLAEKGYKIWVDYDEITPGANLYGKMADGIVKSDAVIIFVTKDYCLSQNCLSECYFSNEKQKSRIFIVLGDLKADDDPDLNSVKLIMAGKAKLYAFKNKRFDPWSEELFQELLKGIEELIGRSINLAANTINNNTTNEPSECIETKFLRVEITEESRGKNIKLKDIELKTLCCLPNGKILICCGSYLMLFEKDFKTRTAISTLNNKSFDCSYATTNNKDKIYLTNTEDQQIIMTDLNLGFLKSFGSFGNLDGEFMNPLGIFYHEGSIYVCDSINSRIQVFNENLTNSTQYRIDFAPITIQIIDKTICIRGRKKIAFYDLDFYTPTDYDRGYGGVTALNNYFYEFIHDEHYIYCYKTNGELMDEFDDKIFKEYISDEFDGQLVKIDNSIYLLSSSKCELVFLQEVQ